MFYLLTQRDKLKRLPEDAAILETAMIHHMSDAESDTEKGLFNRILPWRDNHLKDLIRRCNVSMSNPSYQFKCFGSKRCY